MALETTTVRVGHHLIVVHENYPSPYILIIHNVSESVDISYFVSRTQLEYNYSHGSPLKLTHDLRDGGKFALSTN